MSSGFADGGEPSGDFFEDIRKEYEQQRRRQHQAARDYEERARANDTPPQPKVDDFHRRHSDGLRKRGIFSTVAAAPVPASYERYAKELQTFLKDGAGRGIPWPPVTPGDMDGLLRFVGHNLSHLRQLQVDWHPDRFLRRIPSRIEQTSQIVDRVTKLSQFFNTAVAELRSRKDSQDR